VETNDVFGRVKGINLRTTDLETFQGQTVLIPNKQAFQNPIVNYSDKGYRRIDLVVGISYGDDLEKVSKVTFEAVKEIETLDESREVDLYFEEFGNSSINFVVRFWVRFAKQTDYLEARSESIMRIKAAYDRNDITIPFPIRTLDFGIKGGGKLSEILPSHGENTS
jgi:small conductance mechanosensitive channel